MLKTPHDSIPLPYVNEQPRTQCMHFSQCTWEAKGQNQHSWVSASRPIPLASAIRQP
jgi:hypothetical protein